MADDMIVHTKITLFWRTKAPDSPWEGLREFLIGVLLCCALVLRLPKIKSWCLTLVDSQSETNGFEFEALSKPMSREDCWIHSKHFKQRERFSVATCKMSGRTGRAMMTFPRGQEEAGATLLPQVLEVWLPYSCSVQVLTPSCCWNSWVPLATCHSSWGVTLPPVRLTS